MLLPVNGLNRQNMFCTSLKK